MSRPAHFLDKYRFQIEEMVKLRCTDDHILKVLHDTQKDVQFSKETLVRYMDEAGIRKRRVVKGWTQEQVFECEDVCGKLRGEIWVQMKKRKRNQGKMKYISVLTVDVRLSEITST